jgi:hypothetical protein
MDYLQACEKLPKPRFAVGQQVRIIGPSQTGETCGVGTAAIIEAAQTGDEIGFFNVMPQVGRAWTYPASSLTPIAEVPAPKFKRGDKVQRVTGGVQLAVTGIEYDGKAWVYIFHTNNTTLVIAEEYLSPAPAEPVYLPTRWVGVARKTDSDGDWVTDWARSDLSKEPTDYMGEEPFQTHILHDMPADENGVHVDFVTLTDAWYLVAKMPSGTYSWLLNANKWHDEYPTAIDAWRAAGRHYLKSKGSK